MAKKKKSDELSFGQLPFPQGQSRYRSVKVNWCSLNKRQTMNTGDLSYEKNISTKEPPYLTPSETPASVFNGYKSQGTDESVIPIGLFGFDNMLCVVYYKSVNTDLEGTFVDCIDVVYNDDGGINKGKTVTHTVFLSSEKSVDTQRCILKFNKYDTDALLDGTYTKKLVVLPDKVAFNYVFKELASGGKTQVDEDDGTAYWVDSKGKKSVVLASGITYWLVNNEGNREYYRFDGIETDKTGTKTAVFTGITKTAGGVTYIIADALEVNVREYDGKDKDSLPPEGSDTSAYWQNTNGSKTYRYSEEADSDGNHWKLSSPPSFPPLKYGVVHQSRLFGVSDDKVYASGYNDYSNWNYDTAMDSSYENAWYSTAQANIRADGDFSGITAFDNHVVCFKRDFMQEVYNNKNPFRVVDIYAKGSIDNRSIQEVNGRLIFVSDDEVAVYTGSVPKSIGYKLGIERFREAVSGTDGINYYLFCIDENGAKHLFTYDTTLGEWSEQSCNNEYVDGFAKAGRGMFMLMHDGIVYRLDTGAYTREWAFETDFSTGTSYSSDTAQSLDINHISKIQLLADVGKNAKFSVYAVYDDEDFSQFSDDKKAERLIKCVDAEGLSVLRVYPRLTSHYRYKLHFEGSGYVKLYNLEVSLRRGGELHE